MAGSSVDVGLIAGQLLVIVGASRLFGLVARPLRQPLVIAEILAGIALGPTVLGRLWPGAVSAVFPASSLPALEAVAQVGLLLFMFVVGLELDLGLVRRQTGVAARASVGGVVLPFALGATLGWWWYPTFGPAGVDALPFVLFMGAVMSVTAFPVLARIVTERGLSRTPLGGVAMATAALTDVIGWLLVVFATSAAGAHGWAEAAARAVSVSLFLAAMILGVRPMLDRLARRFVRTDRLTSGGLAATLVMLMAVSFLAEKVGLHAMLGAFLFGAIVPIRGALVSAVTSRIEEIVVVLFLPVFFAVTGLKTDLLSAFTGDLVGVTALIIAAAMFGKIVGTTLPGWASGLGARDALTLGVLLDTRGLMEIVVLNIGRELGVLPDTLYAPLVVMALVTTFLTSPIVAALQPAARVLDETRRAAVGAGANAREFRVLVTVARTESIPGLARLGARLAHGGRALATSLVPVREQSEILLPRDQELAADARASDLAARLGAAGVSARAMSFPSDAPARDILLLAEAQRADVVLVGMHQPLVGTAVFGGPIRELAQALRCDLAITLDRGRDGKKVLLVRGGAHDDAVGRIGARLRAAGMQVSEASPERDFERVRSRAKGFDTVVIGVGEPWCPEIGVFDLRSSPVFTIDDANLLFAHTPSRARDP
jgi:Kef-type K+ transport system membrane component KefB